MEHVLWIGGPPGSGKTTVASRLARRHGLRLYSADTRTWEHRDRAIAEGSVAAIRWEALSPQERRAVPPEEALELSLHRERGPLVADDLRALPRAPLVVAEGSTLPARAASDPERAVWLLPTAAFQRARLEERELPDAARALYLLLAETIEREAREHGVPILAVDGSHDVDATVAAVERLFGAALAAGPRAEARHERRTLLREANEAIVAQIRGYYARPWADGDADGVVRGDPHCEEEVDVAVGEAARGPVLAAGHR